MSRSSEPELCCGSRSSSNRRAGAQSRSSEGVGEAGTLSRSSAGVGRISEAQGCEEEVGAKRRGEGERGGEEDTSRGGRGEGSEGAVGAAVSGEDRSAGGDGASG